MICLLVGRWKGGPFATGELQQTNDKGGVAWQKLQESESWRNINQMHVKLSYFPHTYPDPVQVHWAGPKQDKRPRKGRRKRTK